MMNRSKNSGGGKSSLGYLFGSNEKGKQAHESKVASTAPMPMPPYATDQVEEKAITLPTNKDAKKYIYHGDGTDFLVSGRPSTKVKSVPGGDSSLGYLFGFGDNINIK